MGFSYGTMMDGRQATPTNYGRSLRGKGAAAQERAELARINGGKAEALGKGTVDDPNVHRYARAAGLTPDQAVLALKLPRGRQRDAYIRSCSRSKRRGAEAW